MKELRKSAIGILHLEILGAYGLVPTKTKEGKGSADPYCVVKYGEKWVRTHTLLDTFTPRWKEQYTWDVFDLGTVVTIAVFDDRHGEAKDQQIGKTRIRLTILETNRTYTNSYPLISLFPSGVKKLGELQLVVRFTCKSWPKMLAMYGKPLVHWMDHIPAAQRDHLRFQAVQMVAKQLQRAEPPLRKEVVEYMLDVDSHMFSMRRSKANFFRLMYAMSGVVAVGKWFDGICKWKNPLMTILVHVVFLISVSYSELILPMVFLCMIMIAMWNFRLRPRHTPQMDTKVSQAEVAHPDELDEEFDMLPPPYMDTVMSYLDQVHPDPEEELNTPKRPVDVVRLRYDRLRSIASRVQTVVGDLASQVERLESLLNWRDPRATAIFITLPLVLAIALYLTPFRVVAMVIGLYSLRPPWFRGKPTMFANFYRRLPSKQDMMMMM